jgi:plastocyanin
MRYVFHAVLMLCCGTVLAGPFEMQFVGVDGKAISGAVVTLRSTDPARPSARPSPAVMDQAKLAFVPHVLVVPRGSPVTFPNSDAVSHQVYSFSPAKPFKLPLYRGTPYPPVLFDNGGIVTLGCNIHDHMRAYVFVVEAQYYGRTDAQGRWSERDVQPGEYQLTIHHPLSRTQQAVLEQRVMIDTDDVGLTLRAAAPLKLRSGPQVPANWDAY